ncbi:MAG TPA: S8 family serine peptidase [Candidatus Xenobia bacterium]|nr:S8 family serine peptidase [Candidatus Xenobia bacterium]
MKRLIAFSAVLVVFSFGLPAMAGKPGEIAPGRYFVRFRSDVGQPVAVAKQLSQRHGFRVGHVYRHAVRGMAIEVPPQAEAGILNALARDPRVESVGHDRYIGLFVQAVPKGVNRINAEPGVAANNGNSIRVAVFDTGLDFEHPDLAANIDFDNSADCVFWGTLLGDCLVPAGQDDHWHGTFVGGVIAALNDGTDVVGVAPVARLLAIKVLDSGGSGLFTDIIAGVDYVTRLNANPSTFVHVANMSLGARCAACTDNSTDPTIRAFHDSVRALVDSGTTLVVAAGNDGANAFDTVPASFDEVVTVSALADSDGQPGGFGPSQQLSGGPPMPDDTFAWFSNFGQDIDVIGPGVLELSLNLGGGTRVSSGTSFSSPHAAGVAAVFYRHWMNTHGGSRPTPGAVRQALIETGECHEGAGGVFHGTVGCLEGWPGDPDGLNEPLVRADNVDSFGTPPVVNDVAVTSVSVPSPVFVNTAQTVGVGVANQGTQSETFTVSLSDSLAATISSAQSVTLGAGASATLSFSWTPTVTGDHQLTATASPVTGESDTADNTKSATSTVQEPIHDVAVTGVSAPASATQGSSATVNVNVANQGTFAEVFNLSLSDNLAATIGGSPQSVTLAAGASTTVSFSWTPTVAGTHTLTATADMVPGETDLGDNSGSASSNVTAPPTNTIHVGDLDGTRVSVKSSWRATVTITVHNASHAAVSGAALSGSWSGGFSGSVSCTTNGSGQCTFTTGNIPKKSGSVTFTVTGVSLSGFTYQLSDNHDPDGDSTGTAITVLKP